MKIIEPKIKAYITAQLRRIFRWTKMYKTCKDNAHIHGYIYKCDGCTLYIDKDGLQGSEHFFQESFVFPLYAEKMYVDHIETCTPLKGFINDEEWITTVIGRMFPGVEGLQYLCNSCHLIKTNIENDERREFKRGLKDEKLI